MKYIQMPSFFDFLKILFDYFTCYLARPGWREIASVYSPAGL
ncbi:MAG: hypothetical protein V4534_07930 [Myxococcota bacterium]